MVKQVLMFAAVAVGFAEGGRLGGQVGSILGGVAAFAVALQVAERVQYARCGRGYWLRHRAAFLEFGLAVLGMTLGGWLLGGFWGFVAGPALGTWAGLALAERWGWSGAAWRVQMDARSEYLGALVSAARADGVITPAEAGRVAEVGRELFAHLGYGDEGDVAHVVAQLAANPAPVDHAARYLAGLDPGLQGTLQFDILRIIYTGGEPSPPNRAWLDECIRGAGLGEWPLLRYFDRSFAGAAGDRRAWLAELGLDEAADAAAIRAAYRAGALSYHPDKLAGVPPPVRALAEAKMAAINEAYRRLADAGPAAPAVLHFRHPDAARSFFPEGDGEFTCRCWLCGRLGRVPARAVPETCRCGECHALSGLPFDPLAG